MGVDSESIKYWKRFLADASPCTFPTLADGYNRGTHRSRIPVEFDEPQIASRIQEFCALHGVSARTIFSAAWALVLKTYVGSGAVTFTYFLRKENDERVGLWTTSIEEVDSLLKIVQDLQHDLTNSNPYQTKSLSEIAQYQGEDGRPICNTACDFCDGDKDKRIVSDDVDVVLHVHASRDRVEASLSYSGLRLSNAHAVSVVASFKQILWEILVDPWRNLADVQLIHSDHVTRVFEWNKNYPAPVNDCVGNLFRAQVNLHPDNAAVHSSDDSLSYEELDALSTRLSRHVQSRGIGAEQVVLLCFPKSAWAVVAMIAVVKAGGTFLFLDASHPVARLQEIQSQVNSTLILTAPQYADMWDWTGAEVFGVERSSVAALPSNEHVPTAVVVSSNMLYIIFTSGSTGKPKGCVIEHRQFLTGSLAQQRASTMVHSDRVLQLASFTFDVSILEILTSLITGACVCIPGDEHRAKGPAHCVQEFSITWAFLTPSLVKLMTPEMVPTLRFLVLGGEALTRENIETWAPHLQLANGYGPTECSIAATGNRKLDPGTDPANIGFALGAVCWIVDPENHRRLVPIGAPGELLVQGPIVARGYFNDPAKTESVFVDDFPWLPENRSGSSRRMYKTGDLARYNADGTINFIGRKDSQVKLRGLRIELGEIEHHVAVHPLVQQAAVLLPRQGPCKNQLTGVISLKDLHSESSSLELVPEDEYERASTTAGVVADDISKNLPVYMLPTVWAVVQSIPLTISGKLNRVMTMKWVVDMNDETYNAITNFDNKARSQEVITPLEEQLRQICSTVLSISSDRIRLSRSFVNNGGDSILAMQLMGMWRLEGVAVSVQDVLQSKTLMELADRAANAAAATNIDYQMNYDVEKLKAEVLPRLSLDADQVEEAYPLSPMQRGILLSQQRQAGTYELRISCEVIPQDGQIIDKQRMVAAWKAVVHRHSSLRTVFVDSIAEDGFNDQIVLKSSPMQVAEIHCSDEQDFIQSAETRPLLASDTQPPVSFTIGETSAGKVLCAAAISHALIDGVSILLLFRDLSLAYSGLLDRDAQMQYSRYIAYLQAQSSQTAMEYWKHYLTGLVPCQFPSLNDDISEPNELHELRMELDHIAKLTKFCRTHNMTPASVFQTAWALVLKAYTSSEDVCFGYLSAGRDAPLVDIGDTIGVYINMLVCRLRLSSGAKVGELVEAVQTAFLDGLPHQNCSLAEIQHALQIQEPLFNTVLSLQSAFGEVMRGKPLEDSVGFKIVGERDPTEYNVSVNVAITKEAVRINMRHYTATLSDAMAKNVLDRLKHAIECILDNASKSISELPSLSERDRNQIFHWNKTQWGNMEACIHDKITEQVRFRPTATAIHAWDGKLTYQELENLSTDLSKYLIHLGVGPETLVPMCFNKSMWTVVAQLAVLKAGGACVALDPSHPRGRREDLLRQCDAHLALVAPQNKGLFEGLVDTVVVVQKSLLDKPPQNGHVISPKSVVKPSNTAFVVFTSGSTGKPKGIVLEHHALYTSSRAHGPAMNYGPEARVLQFASYTFDVSIGETFTCLLNGGTLCVPHDDERMNDLAGAINRMNVNVAYLTPSVAGILQPSEVPGLKTLALGGEAVRAENIITWADKLHLVNIYGPAECSVWSTGLEPVLPGMSPANIGFGLGALMWITEIDDHNSLCAVGCVGELLIEGPIVARSYLKDEEKTTAAFISDPSWLPFNPATGSRRMYRTGDLARYNSDGSVSFVGRRDYQIKLHGQRVELPEIEHNLLLHESVLNAVVILPKNGSLKEKLVAVISLRDFSNPERTSEVKLVDGEAKSAAQGKIALVREHLLDRVPGYMMPAVWLVVESIPLSVNGKTDRSCLGRWTEAIERNEDDMGAVSRQDIIAPINKAEKALRAVVSLVLNFSADQISMDQSFLSLGGDSITAMQVSARCRSKSMLVTVKDVLRSKSITHLAQTVKIVEGGPEDVGGAGIEARFQLLPDSSLDHLENEVQLMGLTGLRDIEDAYPCSPMQQGILISQAQSSEAYKFHVVCEAIAANQNYTISMERLQQAWQRIVDRHSSLRTVFIESASKGGLYNQIVLKKFAARIEEVKDKIALLEYPDAVPVNYEKKVPPHRLTVCLDKDRIFFNLEISHALIDGGSMAIILRDMASAYEQSLPVGPLYRDYISLLQKNVPEQSLAYWKDYLRDVEPSKFPALNESLVVTREIRVAKVSIPESVVQKVHTFAQQNSFTLANVFQTAWALLLRTFTSSTNVLFGYLASGRDVPISGIEDAVGPFINMLVCRVNTESHIPVFDAIRKIQDDYLECLPYQHTSLAEIQHALNFSGERLFNTILSLQRPMTEDVDKSSPIGIQFIEGSDPTEYDLSVNVSASDKIVEASITYWTTMLSTEQAAMVATTFSTILSSIVQQSDSTIAGLDLLGPGPREKIFHWNKKGVVPKTVNSCIHELVEKWANDRPDAPAVCSWDAKLSFGELNDYASKLAHHLQDLGVGPEVKVPLCFDKSAWTIVSMLAILKAGGAYVSMDPSHPKQHLANIINEIKSKIILTGSEKYVEKLSGIAGHVIVVEQSLFSGLKSNSRPLNVTVSPENAAFVCFTSGSTGKPKGIVLKHSGFCSMVASNKEMGINDSSRVFQFAAYTFDTSNSEIFTSLVSGGCVCVPSDDERINDPAGSMNRLRVNWTFLTPSMASLLSPQEVPTLKTLALGGEQVREDIVSKWKDHVTVINSYGPAECTIWTSMAYLGRGNSPATIGTGNGSLLWVADALDDERLAPIGCIGELLIEGPILAHGYLDPEKTEQAFIKPPAWRGTAAPGSKLYKTGDLVRYHKDGTLIYVGRKDCQVKLHGQRIEMSDIERQIANNEAIRYATVLLPKNGVCKRRLVAVVAPYEFSSSTVASLEPTVIRNKDRRARAALKVAEVQDQLSTQVPGYMVPSIWLMAETFPFTTSKKVDRVRISRWVEELDSQIYSDARHVEEEEYSERNVTPREKQIQAIVGHVLGLPVGQVWLTKSFLNLGGDSILAMQLINQCRREGLRVTVKDVMRSKTLSALATSAQESAGANLSKTEAFNMPFELSPIQQMYFEEITHSSNDRSENQFNQSFLLRLSKAAKAEDLEDAVKKLVQRHSMLRARFRKASSGQWSQFVLGNIDGSYNFRIHHVESREEALDIAERDQASLDIENGPVFAADLFNISEQNQLLFMVAHHLVIDLVSWRVILRQLEEALQSGSALEGATPLPFQTWVKMQAQYSASNLDPGVALPHLVPEADYGFWGMNETANLRGDIDEIAFSLNEKDTRFLLRDCHEALKTEPLDVFLSALFQSFSRTFGRTPPAVFNEGHGREPWDPQIDVSETVGWFTTMFPLHTPVALETEFLDIIRQTKDQRRQLPRNGWAYFASRFLHGDGRKAFVKHTPIEILFNYLGHYQGSERTNTLLRIEPFNQGDVGPAAYRFALFEINVYIVGGAARFSFTFNRKMQHQNLIREWVRNYQKALLEAGQLLQKAAPTLTLSEYPLLPVVFPALQKFQLETLPKLGISKDNIEDVYACSPMQEGILLSQSRLSDVYQIQTIVEVASAIGKKIDVQRLHAAWQTVVDRHASLRTVFIQQLTMRPYDQIVLKKYATELSIIRSENETALDDFSKLKATRYRVAQPPHSFTMLETADGRVYSKLEVNHALVDGTSMAILISEIALAYQQELSATPGPLYSDYIAHLQFQPPGKALRFWTEHLSEVKPCHFPLLIDNHIESEKHLRKINVEVPNSAQVRSFCRQHNVTLANIFRLAWGVILRAFTGDDQVCFGYLASGREIPVPGIESAVGAFINMLTCSLDFTQMGKKSAAEGLEELQDEYLKVLPWQHTSLAEIQHELGLAGQPLFNTVLSFQRRAMNNFGAGDIMFKYLAGEDPTEYDISINIADSEEGIHVIMSYLTSRLSDGQAANVSGALSTALLSIFKTPESTIESLDIFGERDSRQVWAWNKNCPPLVSECVHTIFQNNARKNPAAPAIASFDNNFTYEELDVKTTQLAQHLISLGISPDVLVPICFEKSSWAVIAMLSIMKAGGGFVPLDPVHPTDRHKAIISQTNSSLALVSDQMSDRLTSLVERVVVVAPSSDFFKKENIGEFRSSVKPNHAAYTLFTSGSTGTPKGVLLDHSAVSSSIIHHGAKIGCSLATRMFQFAAYTFDACILEIFTTLAYGGCICIPSDAERMSDIAGSMTRLHANTSFLTPSVVRILTPQQVPTLQTLILGGEALGQDNIRIWSDKVRLMNGYGPTETCVFCVMKTFEGKKDRNDILGHAVSSLSWIVRPDDYNQLAPVGSVGMLLVQGPTLAREYLHDPAKTSGVFIKNPGFLPKVPGTPQRLYVTGDLARYNSDGTITYLGRRDTQVKLRGQRIELAEIEHQVKSSFLAASQVGVEVIVPHGEGEKATLAAFFSLADHEDDEPLFVTLSAALKVKLLELQKNLTGVLPPYMIPSLYIHVGRMPTTTAGKLDRRALRDAAAELSDEELSASSLLDSNRRAPETVAEKAMAELWHKVLKISLVQIGADDNFFRLGGDSIMAMRLAAASTPKMSLKVADIFRYPTLSEMATLATGADAPTPVVEIVKFELLNDIADLEEVRREIASKCVVEESSVDDAYPCTPLQEGLVALSILRPGAYMAQKIFKLPTSMDLKRFKNAWESCIEMHSILRTAIIQTATAGSLQVVLKNSFKWRTADTLDEYVAKDNRELVAYGKPLSRFAITKDFHFVWTAHHAMYDGWSVPLILEQVKCAYEKGSAFPAPGFNTFIKYLSTTNPESSGSYWKEQFAGERPSSFPELPSATHQLNVSQVSHLSIPISRKSGSDILISSILRAAWALVQGKYADSQDVVFGVTLSGRNAPIPGINKMLGPTITTVPVRVRMHQERTVAQFLQEVQQQAIEMIPHEHLGLQNISRLNPEIAKAVEFQNLFVVQPLSQFDVHGHELLGAAEVSIPMENFDTYPLIFECSLSKNKVEIETRYDREVISERQMKRMLDHFEHVVRLLNEETSGKVLADIDMFTQKDEMQILEWNHQYPEVLQTCVPEVFAQQVRLQPHALAVDAWDGDFTYSELDELSTRFAHYLVANGVGPEVLVPLCFEKSRWAVVVQMSVMKAGGGCVNLDPTHPPSRLAFIIQDARATVMLVAPQYADKFGSNGPQVVTVTEKLLRSLPAPSTTTLPQISPTDTAYVLFTSGSTGKPKGIVIEHGSLCTSSKAHGSRWNIGPDTRLLQFAAYTFDVSCADIFTTLQRGGCVCVPSEHDRMNDLAGAINKFKCNWAFLTPTVASLLPADGIPTLKKLVLGGEASTRDTIRKWHHVLDLIVCYGPAECSVYCSGASPATETSDPADLGSAIGALYWVVDPTDHNRLMPVGCIGELLLEGRTVARGYLHDKEKTVNAFVANPTWATGGTSERPRRFYKTGDLVRYNEDGTIHFVGRKDTQVKIRGQRVELGEIEHAIRVAFPSIAHVTVDAVKQQAQGNRQVVIAFLHTTTNSGPAQALPMSSKLRTEMISLQRALNESLPSYMVPSMFIPMAQVSLTMNGKADRRQLRDMVSSLPREEALIYSLDDAMKQEPTTEMEFKLRALWGRIMGIDEMTIGVGDHFFRLGGDSILAMKLVGAASEQDIVLSVKDLFMKPVLAEMAAYASSRAHVLTNGLQPYEPFSLIEADLRAKTILDISSQMRVGEKDIADILPATDFQQNAFTHALMKTRGFLNYLFLDGTGRLDIELSKKSCLQLVQEHEILRTVFAVYKDAFVQVVVKEPEVDFEMHETDKNVADFSAALCRKDVEVDMTVGQSLVKFMIVKAKNESAHRIIMRVSHAQYDGVCLPRIWKSFEDAFAGRATANAAIPFSTYIAAASHIQIEETQEYWRALLHDSAMTNVVAHHKPSYRNVYNLVTKRTIPNISLASAGLTFATVLKSAWAVVLASLSGSTDVVFGHVVSGRNLDAHGINEVVGPCLNIIPVRITLSSSKTSLSLAKNVQDQHIASMPFENLGSRFIIRDCTSWPKWTRFSSVVQHQNIHEESVLNLRGNKYEIGYFAPQADEADVAVKSTPMGDKIEIVLICSNSGVGERMANVLLDMLCEIIVALPQSLDIPALSLPKRSGGKAVLPILPSITNGANGFSVNGSENMTGLDFSSPLRGKMQTPFSPISEEIWGKFTLRKEVLDMWSVVLREKQQGLFGETDFFEVGGDLVGAALLKCLIEMKRMGWGRKVGVEELIEGSDLADMVGLLTRS